MMWKEDAVRQWGEEGVLSFHPDAIRDLDIPADAKTILSQPGIPREVDPFFYATNVEETRVPTLREYARTVGAPVSDRGDSYYRVGTDYGTEICLTKGSGEVVSIDMHGELPDRFVNSSVEQFVTFLYLVSRERAQYLGLSDEEIDRRVLSLEEELARIDPKALHDPENWWAVIMEQMRNGLL